MSNQPEKHYTAVIQIEEVIPESVLPETNRSFVQELKKKPRQVNEVAKIIVRAKTINGLVEKVRSHTELLREVEEGDGN